MKRFFLLLIFLLSTTSVYAAEWINIGQDLFLDKSSIQYVYKNRTYKAWIKEIKPKEIILSFNEYNINEREWRNLDKVTMDLQNHIKSRDTSKNIGCTWVNVVPESNSALEINAIKKEITLLADKTNSKKSDLSKQ